MEEDFYGSSDHHHLHTTTTATTSFTTKGRRTKRQRTATATSSYGAVGGATCVDNSYGSSASATPSDDHDIMSEVTTEEQDMANCLILLAQGVQRRPTSTTNKSKAANTTNINTSTCNNNNKNDTSTSIGVYECKTCNKTFHSFQALGGHRTSHKKVKPPTAILVQSPSVDDHDRDRDLVLVVDDHLDGVSYSSPLPSQANNNHDDNNNNNTSKKHNNSKDNSKVRVHECSICGSEFPSGQALGGHMRRHRAVMAPTPADRQIITTAIMGGPRNILSLDLNLPAPDDHDQVIEDIHMVETKFHVLPTPALVDCHY